MRYTCENDHVRNLANFDALIAKIVDYGRYYKPSKSAIQLQALSIVSQNAKAAIANVTLLTGDYVHSVNLREVAFDSLKELNKKIYQVLQISNSISETEMYMLVGSSKVICNPFSSQQRYDFLLENFCKMIKLLKANPLYLPKKTELQLSKLEEFYAILYLKNSEVKQNQAWLSNACLIRNEVFYRDHNGLLALATAAKMYIKYHFGWDSKQFKQVADLLIKKAK
ncbi:MAG: hypothetical protein EOO07_06230 [Chitinophagaceae bacterium]|nr:MAG: hypothetical protein EOO07_06230 [Chitinophagaceae bacterium]